MRQAIRLGVTILLSAGILCAIVFAVGFDRTVEAVAEAGVAAFVAVGCLMALTLFVQTITWDTLNRPIGHDIPFFKLFRGSVVGQAGNIITPSTYLGGEALRVLYVGGSEELPYHEVAGSVLLSKYLEAISFILLVGVTATAALVRYRAMLFGPDLVGGVLILLFTGGLVILGVVLWISLWQRWRPLTWLASGLTRLPVFPNRMSRFRVRVRSMEDQVSRVFREESQVVWKVFGAHAVGHVGVFLRPAIFFYLGADWVLDAGQLGLLFVVGQVLLMVQLTPSGAGILDGGYIGAFALMGFDEADYLAKCMAYLLCLRFWDILIVCAGSVLASRAGVRLFFSQGKKPGRPDSPRAEGTPDAGEPGSE